MDTSQGRPRDTAAASAVPYDAVILAGGRAERLGGMDKPGALVGGRPLIERVAAAVPDARRLIIVGPTRSTPNAGRVPESNPPLAAAPDATSAHDPLANAVYTREDPPGGGPVPALRAGLAEVTADWVVVLAADLPFLAARHVAALFQAARPELVADESGGPSPSDMSFTSGGSGRVSMSGGSGTSRMSGGSGTGRGAGGVLAGAVLVDDGGREQWLTGVWRTAVLKEALNRYDGRSLHRLLGPLEPARVHLPATEDGCPPWFDCDTMDDLGTARVRVWPAETP